MRASPLTGERTKAKERATQPDSTMSRERAIEAESTTRWERNNHKELTMTKTLHEIALELQMARVRHVLTTFYRAELSMSSLQPVLDLAQELMQQPDGVLSEPLRARAPWSPSEP